jgi:hypothetical protein
MMRKRTDIDQKKLSSLFYEYMNNKNGFPESVFGGDTGSLACGAAIGATPR